MRFTVWPARAGETARGWDRALVAPMPVLKQENGSDLVSLHDDVRFQALLARIH